MKTVWQERTTYFEKTNINHNEKTQGDTTTNLCFLSETAKIYNNLKSEVKELLEENQRSFQAEIKEILLSMRNIKTTED